MMMLSGDDLNLTRFPQGFGQLAMEKLKQEILDHELIFRSQVRELHRLYWTQKNLMNEHLKRTFDLQLPADNYINAVRNNLDKNLSDTGISNADSAEKEAVGVGNKEEIVEYGLRSLHISSFNEEIVPDNSLVLGPHEGDQKGFQPVGIEFLAHKVPAMLEPKQTGPNDKDSISMEGSNAPCAPSAVQFSEGDGRILLPHFYRVGLDDSSLTSTQNHSINLKKSTNVLIDLNLPYEDESCQHQNGPDSLNPYATSLCEKNVDLMLHFGRDIGPFDENKRQDVNVTVWNSINMPYTSHAIAEEEANNQKFSAGCNSECSSSDEKGAEEPASVSITDESDITQLHFPEEEDIATVTAAGILMAMATVQTDRMC